jgi:hypothetical protein
MKYSYEARCADCFFLVEGSTWNWPYPLGVIAPIQSQQPELGSGIMYVDSRSSNEAVDGTPYRYGMLPHIRQTRHCCERNMSSCPAAPGTPPSSNHARSSRKLVGLVSRPGERHVCPV